MNTERTPIFYMANLGVEVARIFSCKKKNETNMMRGAYDRAKGIIAKLLTTNSPGAREESKIMENIIDDIVSPTPRYHISAESLNDYFTPFMLKANREAGIV